MLRAVPHTEVTNASALVEAFLFAAIRLAETPLDSLT